VKDRLDDVSALSSAPGAPEEYAARFGDLFGTIPDCTGLDHADFLDPGAEVEITFERLGTLHCRLAEPAGKLQPSRWPVRPTLMKYHEGSEGDL
jgi:hypothetical protein